MTAPRARKAQTGDSFDAFWAEQSSGKTTVIRGVEVPVPCDIPIAVELRVQELQESTSEDDMRELLSMLFGVDVLDQWSANGMGGLELQTVIAWAMGQGTGADTTFEEALELVRSQRGEGKAPSGQNRAARRQQSKSTGGPSKPTSRASTASTRNRSRA